MPNRSLFKNGNISSVTTFRYTQTEYRVGNSKVLRRSTKITLQSEFKVPLGTEFLNHKFESQNHEMDQELSELVQI